MEQKKISSSQIYHIEYEKLSSDPVGIISPILQKLNLNVDKDIVTEIKRLKNIQSHTNRKSGVKNLQHDASKSSIGRWKKELSLKEQRIIQPYLEHISYEINLGLQMLKKSIAFN